MAGDVMENQSIIKKIINFLANLFKVIIIMILNLIRSLFGKSKITPNKEKTKYINNNIEEQNTGTKPTANTSNTGLPDEDNLKTNEQNTSTETDNTENDILLELPKYKINNLNKRIEDEKVNLLTAKLVSECIDLELEEIYKEQKFKVKDAPHEIEEKIIELKKKIIPKIVEKINNNQLLTKEEVKKEVKKKVEEELKEKPILKIEPKVESTKLENPQQEEKQKSSEQPRESSFSKENLLEKATTEVNKNLSPKPTIEFNQKEPFINENTSHKESQENEKRKEEIYFLAIPHKKELKLPQNKPVKAQKQEKIATVNNSIELKEKIDNTPIKMVKNVDTIPKSFPNIVANAALTSGIIAADITREMFGSTKKTIEDKKANTEKEKRDITPSSPSKSQEKVTAETLDIKGISNIEKTKAELEADTKSIQELTELQKELEEKIEQIKKENKKDSKQEEAVVKDLMKDTEVSAIAQTSEALIKEGEAETKKEEFEDKDYDRIERQLDKMLEDITNTYLRYEDKMTPKQKAKLEMEENKLRYAREHIQVCKEKDIAVEQRILDEEITSREINGLQEELKKLDVQNKIEANENLLKKLDKMEGMTREQVANVDKRILTKRLRKASLLLEMSSLLAFPFIHNRYFFYFTAGLIIDNHFNFINAFFRRKVNRYEPADLSQIKKGQDALNGALDITYKNLVELDYIEQQALSKYPELANNPEFISQIMHLKTKLNQNYNKLMRKNKVMENYYYRSKQQKRILKKDLKPEDNKA